MKIITIALLIFTGCQLFNPREAEPPVSFGTGSYRSYTDILNELSDIYLENRASDIKDILPELDTAFTFEVDQDDIIQGISNVWHTPDEIEITKSMLEKDSVINFNFKESILFKSDDSVSIEWDYSILRGDGVTIKGESIFSIEKFNNRYYLTKWIDKTFSSTPVADTISWGKWKLETLTKQ